MLTVRWLESAQPPSMARAWSSARDVPRRIRLTTTTETLMTACTSCGAHIAAEDQYCSECGAPASTRTASATPPPVPPSRNAPNAPRRAFPSAQMASPTVAGDVILATPDQDSELAGQAVPNPHYTGNRLVYQNGEIESLDPVNIRYLKALQMHWAIVFIIFAVGVAADALVFAVILGSSRLAVIVAVLWWLVMGVVAWWFPIWVSISEWKFMIDGKGSASGAAFEHIKWAFSQRESPIHRIRVHRLS